MSYMATNERGFDDLSDDALSRATGGQFNGAAAMMRVATENALASDALSFARQLERGPGAWSLGWASHPELPIMGADGVKVQHTARSGAISLGRYTNINGMKMVEFER
jgi:hypothetical protein